MGVYNLIVKFNVGTEKVIEKVSKYGLDNNGNYFYVEKNGYRIFIPKENVLYIGREFDLSEE